MRSSIHFIRQNSSYFDCAESNKFIFAWKHHDLKQLVGPPLSYFRIQPTLRRNRFTFIRDRGSSYQWRSSCDCAQNAWFIKAIQVTATRRLLSLSCATYTIVSILWKRTERDFSGKILKAASINGSTNSIPSAFHRHQQHSMNYFSPGLAQSLSLSALVTD